MDKRKKVVVIGGGFGGVTVCRRLSKFFHALDVSLIDPRSEANFLPALPDIMSGRLLSDHLKFSLIKLKNVNYVQDSVDAIDIGKNSVITKNNPNGIGYDYLVIASGSQTFFPFPKFLNGHSFKLDNVDDAQKIHAALKIKLYKNYVIIGSSYTAVEWASHMALFLKKKKMDDIKVTIVSRSVPLKILEEQDRNFVLKGLSKLKIKIVCNSQINDVQDKEVWLSTGEYFDNACVCWATGVKTASFVHKLPYKRDDMERLKVDSCLRVSENIFAVGDSACFEYQGNALRMAVQFSVSEGRVAAKNIIRHLKGKPLLEYHPIDLGFIVPVANGYSCGKILGIKARGLFPTFSHYMLCILKSFDFKARVGIFFDLIRFNK